MSVRSTSIRHSALGLDLIPKKKDTDLDRWMRISDTTRRLWVRIPAEIEFYY
jgi:hypothetical protein